jgi:hypothetical protein
MAVKSKQIVKDAKGNPIPGLYKVTYTGGTVSYTRTYQTNFERKTETYSSNEKAKAIKDQLAFIRSKPESSLSKIRNYLDDLLKKPGPVFVNQNSLAKKLGVKQSAISLTLKEPKYRKIKITRTDLPADYAKARGQDGEAFVKYLKDNKISDSDWLKDQKGGNFRSATFRNFEASIKESERVKAIPKGYISEQDLSEKIFDGNRSELSEKTKTGKKRFNATLAEGIKKLNPIEGRSPVSFFPINYYKNPTEKQLKNLIDVSRESQQIQKRTLENINTILKDKQIKNLFTNFSQGDSLPSWDRMKQIYTKQGLTSPSNNTMATAVVQLARVLQGKGRKGTEGLKINVNKNAGKTLLVKMSEGSMFGNPWSAAAQNEVYNVIDERLGRNVGTFQKFRRDVKDILRKEGIPLYAGKGTTGFNLNEVLGTRAQVKNEAFPYTQFVDLAEGEFNQKELNYFQKKLGNRQKAVVDALKNNNIDEAKNIIKDFRDTRTDLSKKFKNANLGNIYMSEEYLSGLGKKVSGNYKGDAYVKNLSQIYNEMDLKNWKESYGLDLEKYARTSGVNLDVRGGRPIEQVLDPAYRTTLVNNLSNIRKEFEKNTGNICNIFGTRSFEKGGYAGGCVGQFDEAIQKNPQGLFQKVLNFAKSPGFKTFSVAGLAGGAAAALVKEFKNDDPTTYLSNEDQQKSMLVDMVTQPISEDMTRPDILDYQLPAVGASLAASTALGAPSTIKASRSRGLGVEQKGLIRTGGRVLGRGLGIAASPGVLAPLAALDITRQVSEGDSLADIATDPINYTYPIFAEQTPRLTRGLPSAFRKFASLGLSKPALRLLSRAGIAGLGASLAIQGIGLLDD